MATTTKALQPQPQAPVIVLPRAKRLPAWLRALLRNPLSITGAIIVIAFVLVALLAPVLAPPKYPDQPYSIPRAGFSAPPKPPSPDHPLGTTEGQYNIYYGIV